MDHSGSSIGRIHAAFIKMGEEVEDFLNGQCILITGGTGFLGKCLLEKILLAYPSVSRIYLLIRSKRGVKDVIARLAKLVESSVFDRLRKENAAAFQKIIPIQGDVSIDNLGMSPEDRKMVQDNVEYVFHSAATVNFNETLRIALNVNVNGTKRMVELCRGMAKLKCLVYISTAYVSCDDCVGGNQVKERVCSVPPGAVSLLQEIVNMKDDYVEKNTKKLIGSKPNTYTFSKTTAEEMLEEMAGNIPVAIVRPAIITSSYKEPVPGWTDNLSGAMGISLAIAKGFLRTLYGDPNAVLDFVPVDYVVHLLLCVAWNTSTNPFPLKVYNCSAHTENPCPLGYHMQLIVQYFQEVCPLSTAFWYPFMDLTLSRTCYNWNKFVHHYLPVVIVDAFGLHGGGAGSGPKNGNKIRFKKIYEIVMKKSQFLEYFMTRSWNFDVDEVINLRQRVKASMHSKSGLSGFDFDFTKINWKEYMKVYCFGLRKYLAAEDDSTISLACSRINRLYWIRIVVQALGYCSLGGTLILFMKMLTHLAVRYRVKLYSRKV